VTDLPDPRADDDPLARNLRRLPGADDAPPTEALVARITRLAADLRRPEAPATTDGDPGALCYKPQIPDRKATGPRSGEGVPMKLQACSKCGSQFDVSQFSRGQQFRCGACGQLIVAHSESAAAPASAGAPVGRAPGSARPSAAAPATASSSVAAARSPRGPQFQPAQRAQEARREPARAAAPERPERERRSRSDIGAKKGPPMALLMGGAALVVAVVVIVAMSGSGKDKPSGGPGAGPGAGGGGAAVQPAPEKPKDTLAAVQSDMKRNRPEKDSEYRGYINRLLALGEPAKEALKSLYEEYIETPAGSEDDAARKALGYVKFAHELPEAITQTKGHDFISAFETARKQRWLQGEDEIRLATEAKKQVDEHARRLLEDRVYRAGESIFANVSKDQFLRDYNLAVRWAAPHLICYASKDRLSDLDLLGMPKKERQKAQEEIAARRRAYQPLLDEKEKIYGQLYAEFNRRFQKSVGLQDLTAEWGGRPDYKVGVRSFQDGVPLVIWVFDNKESINGYHKHSGKNIPDYAAGYFEWSTAWVFLYDERNEGEARVFEIGKNLHEGAHQLEHWFGRQLNSWREPKHSQSWFGEGMAEYFGAHKMKADGTIEFIGMNVSRLGEARAQQAQLKQRGKEYPIVELHEMVTWTNYGQAGEYANKRQYDPSWGMGMFIYQQGWAFFHMCMDGLNGKYREKLDAYLKSVLMREEGPEAFRRAFKIRDEDDWEPLQKDFDAYMKGLLTKDLSPYRYDPPKRPAAK
jgi:hypothetical protein